MISQANRNVESLARKIIRIIGFTIAVQVLAFGFVVRASYTKANEVFMGLGAEMLRFPYARHQDRPRQIHLNGLPIHFTTGSTSQSVEGILDYVHLRCREKNGNLTEQLDKLIKKGRKVFDPHRYPLMDGVLRYGDEKQGFVACLASNNGSSRPEDTVKRIRRFLETGDLSQIGELRYVMAKRGLETTSFVAFWTEGIANLLDLFPRDGDAPGYDLPEIPRPIASRRVLSAWEDGATVALAVYFTPYSALSNSRKTYCRQLELNGWRILSWQKTKMPQDRTGFIAEKAGVTAHVEFLSLGRNGTTIAIAKIN